LLLIAFIVTIAAVFTGWPAVRSPYRRPGLSVAIAVIVAVVVLRYQFDRGLAANMGLRPP
jgi:hypothetical protein